MVTGADRRGNVTHRTDDPDARLMVLAGRGDRSAFRTLVDKYQDDRKH